ncbi:LOW QUALITY PROTEIN: keratin, type I cuticular Ha8-like [Lagenorhynchus albirostris]|uniref:LOW QUALITY PROTEIN: keratin, type I cuticular Ha8-like n=1 Tax=Lagenorhynchus albirostris TaxID=27610 RepID=UPI0028EB5254|nr:LOW QUALITY PROTEIN: keratin, type I cuticular Ha8-like [Lagenorhynchus albirostris]
MSLSHSSTRQLNPSGNNPSGLTQPLSAHSCNATCPLLGTCHIPGNIGICRTYGEGSLNSHEKETMQFPNDRPASYLEKVRHLERDNVELETQIQESSECHEATACLDYQSHFCTIEELQQKILCVKSENSKLVVQIDNAKLTADDNRTKYQTELALPAGEGADVCGLHRALDDLTLAKADLGAQLESLKEELLCLKKNHEQGVHALKCQLGDQLRTELDVVPAVDLGGVLEEMRCPYEALEVELQAQLMLNWLCGSGARFGTELAQMQCLISDVEAQLSEIRTDLERQSQEYQVLLDVKAWLEGEIATCWNLLETEDCKLPCTMCATLASSTCAAPAACTHCSPCLFRPSRASCGPCSSP